MWRFLIYIVSVTMISRLVSDSGLDLEGDVLNPAFGFEQKLQSNTSSVSHQPKRDSHLHTQGFSLRNSIWELSHGKQYSSGHDLIMYLTKEKTRTSFTSVKTKLVEKYFWDWKWYYKNMPPKRCLQWRPHMDKAIIKTLIMQFGIKIVSFPLCYA